MKYVIIAVVIIALLLNMVTDIGLLLNPSKEMHNRIMVGKSIVTALIILFVIGVVYSAVTQNLPQLIRAFTDNYVFLVLAVLNFIVNTVFAKKQKTKAA